MARILVADDDMPVRMIVRLMLEGAGHTVAEAPDGRVALKMWRAAHEPFDLMITDIMMPETDGFEAIIEFRKTWPSAKIIAITGGGQSRTDTFLRTAEKLGVCRTLQKPFDQQLLLAAVREVLEDPSPAPPASSSAGHASEHER